MVLQGLVRRLNVSAFGGHQDAAFMAIKVIMVITEVPARNM